MKFMAIARMPLKYDLMNLLGTTYFLYVWLSITNMFLPTYHFWIIFYTWKFFGLNNYFPSPSQFLEDMVYCNHFISHHIVEIKNKFISHHMVYFVSEFQIP